MARYVVFRLLQTIPVFMGATLLVYFLMFMMPGDPIAGLFGDKTPSPQVIEAIRKQYNLDKPFIIQYLIWLSGIVTGKMGVTFSGQEVSDVLAQAMPVSAQLSFMALIINLIIGLPIGLVAGLRPGRIFDNSTLGLMLIIFALPSFVFAFLIQYFLGIHWKIFPVTVGADTSVYRMMLPALSMGILGSFGYYRFFRGDIMKNRHQDFVTTAYSKGLSSWGVTMRHVVRNSLITVVTIIALDLSGLIGGAIITEGIFNVPGMGNVFYQAILRGEGPTIVSFSAIFVLVFVLITLAVDILYSYIDPRIRLAGRK